MVAPRRARGLKLVLRSRDGHRVVLHRRRDIAPLGLVGLWRGALPSQRELVAAPGGAYLAYRLGGGAIAVRSTSGRVALLPRVEHRDYRFSPDGTAIAYFSRLRSGHGERRVGLFVRRLQSGRTKRLATLRNPRWMEWSRGGVVVHDVLGAKRHALIYARPGAAPKRVAELDRLQRFTAAARAPLAIAFGGKRRHSPTIYAIDLARGGEPRPIAAFDEHVTNAEISPDGRFLAFIGPHRGVYLVAGGKMRRLDPLKRASSLWFTADGRRLVYAGPRRAVAVELASGRRFEYGPPAGERIRTMRLRRDAAGEVLVVSNRRVVAWRPTDGRTRTLARLPERRRASIESADTYDGNTVIWISELGPLVRPRPRPQRRVRLREPRYRLQNPAPGRKRTPSRHAQKQRPQAPLL